MSDQRLRDLERTVREGGDEAARVALDTERRRRGMPSLWGYAPRWCGEGEARHLPGSQTYLCQDCKGPWEEATQHVLKVDAPLNGSHWTRRARRRVALVLRVMLPDAPLREVRAALREVRPSDGSPEIERQWHSKEAVRAFPGLGRKKSIKDHWKGEADADAPLFTGGTS